MRSFFRSMLMYRITGEMPAALLDHAALNAALNTKPSGDPASQQLNRYGFDEIYPRRLLTPSDREEPTFTDEEPEVPERARFVGRGIVVIRARMTKRNMPGGAIKRMVEAKVREIENAQMRKVYKKEREQIKDEVIQAHMPHALVTDTYTYALIDLEAKLILVESSAPARAEDLLSVLRDALGSLPVRPIGTKQSPTEILTRWVRDGNCTNGFHLLDGAYLEDAGEAPGKVGLANVDIGGEEMEQHLAHGRLVKKLALAYEDAFAFMLTDKLIISKLRWDDIYEEQADKDGGEDYAGQLDASYLIQGLKYRDFVADLLEAFGGEELPVGL